MIVEGIALTIAKKQGNRAICEQKLTKYQICDKIRHEIHKELKDDR